MKINLLLLTILFPAMCFSQNSDNPENIRAKIYELKVKTIPDNSLKLPFQSIIIIDSRQDTSKLGFIVTRKNFVNVNKVFEIAKLRPNIASGIENFYNEYYKTIFLQPAKTY